MQLIPAMRVLLALFFLGSFQPLLFAHPTLFHTLEEAQKHIEGHLDGLERILERRGSENRNIQFKFHEIMEHVSELRRLTRELKEKDGMTKTAHSLEWLMHRLVLTSRQHHLFKTVHTLKEIQTLLFQIS